MGTFLHTKKIEVLILSIWVILLNWYYVFFQVIGVDTEEALIELDSNLNWTLGSGRFASALFRKILMPTGFNYTFAVLLAISGWIIVCLAYLYFLEQVGITNKWCGMFFSLFFVSCPIWAEQNYFTCSVFVNVYGMLFAVISAYLLVDSFKDGLKWKNIIFSVILGVFAIGIYQAILYFIMANCVIFLTLNSCKNHVKFSKYIVDGLKCVIAIGTEAVVYFLISKICVGFWYSPSFDYAGYTDANEYIYRRMQWGEVPFSQCWNAISSYIAYSFKADHTYGLPICLVLFVALQLFLIVRFIKTRKSHNVILFLGTFLLLACAFIGCFLYGNTQSVREQFVLPLLIAFCIMILLNECIQYAGNFKGRTKTHVLTVILVLCAYSLMIYSNRQISINRANYVRYSADVEFAANLMSEIKAQVGYYNDKKIVFVGNNQWQLPDNYYRGEVIGYSVFAWDVDGPVGVNYRSYGFLNSCGYSYIKPTIEEVQIVQNVINTGELTIDSDKIMQWNDYVVVDLNQF